MPERIVFFGRNTGYEMTKRCYQALVDNLTNHELVMTVVSDDNHDENHTVEQIAKRVSVPVTSPHENNVNNSEFIEFIKKLDPTIFITVQFPAIFGTDLLSIPRKASLNIHRGWPLRGGSIDERAIFYQLPIYNIILHHMVNTIDGGNILGRRSFPIESDETGYSLVAKADDAAVELFQDDFLPLLGNDIPAGERQNLDETTYGAKNSLSPRINFTSSVEEIERLVRAFYHPRKKGAFFENDGTRIYVGPPTEIKSQVNDQRLSVSTPDGALVFGKYRYDTL